MKPYAPRQPLLAPLQTMSDLAGVYTVPEAASLMEVTVHAVQRAIREGRLRAWARAGVYLIPAAELAQWQPVRGRGRRKEPHLPPTPSPCTRPHPEARISPPGAPQGHPPHEE